MATIGFCSEKMLSTAGAFELKAIAFDGNTAFSDDELRALAAEIVGKEVSIEQLELLRLAISRKYAEAGFVNSGAALDDQDVAGGNLVVRIIEGGLTKVVVDGDTRWHLF